MIHLSQGVSNVVLLSRRAKQFIAITEKYQTFIYQTIIFKYILGKTADDIINEIMPSMRKVIVL